MVATGGNKVRKLEWLIGEAQAQGATHMVTQGAVQSNHVRQTAAVAAMFGLKCTALLEHRIETNDRDYLNSGNVLLDKLFGCEIEYRPGGIDMNAEAEKKGAELRAAGEKAYVIPGRRLEQGRRAGLCVLRAGTGAAGGRDGAADRPAGDRDRQRRAPMRGWSWGWRARTPAIPVLGIGVRLPRDRQEENVFRLAEATADHVGVRGGIPRSAVVANCDYVGKGYGIPTDGHGRGGADAGAAGGDFARPGLFRQSDGRDDRPDPQGRDSARARRWCSCTPAARSGCSGTPGCSRRRWRERRQPYRKHPMNTEERG